MLRRCDSLIWWHWKPEGEGVSGSEQATREEREGSEPFSCRRGERESQRMEGEEEGGGGRRGGRTSRHCFSQTWQYHLSLPRPLLFILLERAFAEPASARGMVARGGRGEGERGGGGLVGGCEGLCGV